MKSRISSRSGIDGNEPRRVCKIREWGTKFKTVVNLVITMVLLSAHSVFADYPDSFPFYDTCMGLDGTSCNPRSDKGNCAFFRDQYPWCFDKSFADIQPQTKAIVGASTLFFTFSSGVHLSGKFR